MTSWRFWDVTTLEVVLSVVIGEIGRGGAATGGHLCGRLGPRPEPLVAAPRDDYPEDYHSWSQKQRKSWKDKHRQKRGTD